MPDLSRPDLVLGIVGAGTMGRGIAQVAAQAGIRVLLTDARPAAVAEARQFVGRMLDRAAEKGTLTREQTAAAAARVEAVDSVAGLAPCHVVIEAVAEDLAVKQALFPELEAAVSDDCILSSNTSALPITSIAARCRLPERVAGTHFFNPVPLMKLVEVIDGVRTRREVGDALMVLGRRLGREPVRCADFPGFLAGNVGRGLTIESGHLVEEGVAGFADVDRVVRDVLGFPMGPFQLIDNNGLDIVHRAIESVHEQFYGESYFRPCVMMKQRVVAGLLGRKTGQGFFEYPDGKTMAVPPEPAAPVQRPASVWVSGAVPSGQRAVVALLGRLGARVESGATPSPQALCVVTPLGEDALTCALREGVDASRTVAVDTLFGLERRRTLMFTPSTRSEHRIAAHGLFCADGVGVTCIADSPGFVAQRIVAMIANIGAWIAQREYASPEDIDKAARLGLGYPRGPFGFVELLGAKRLVAILDAMYARLGDPRYRASLGLRRLAESGTSRGA